MNKIMIATPAYGDVFYTPFVSSILRLTRALQQQKWDFSFSSISYSEIAEGRNFLLTNWFDKTDASHLLFVDADMGFDPQLILDMLNFDKPIVGAIYPRRQIDFSQIAELAARGEPASRAISKSYKYVFRPLHRSLNPKKENGFLEVEACGTGILLIQRSCIAEMLRVLPELNDMNVKNLPVANRLDRVIRCFDVIRVDQKRMSEDYSFCYRWRNQCKGEIWANTTHKITHVGLQAYRASYSESLPGVTSGRLVLNKN